MLVRMLSTLAPSSCSIARLISVLFASWATWNTIVRPSSRRIDVFSVMSGRRITSVSFMLFARLQLALRQSLLQLFERALRRHDARRVEHLARGDPPAGDKRNARDVADRTRQLLVHRDVDQHRLA